MTATLDQLIAAAALLDDAEDYRVLRRFTPRDGYAVRENQHDAVPLKTALYVDVETTGLDTERDEIIELAIVPFEFDADGIVYDVGEGHSWFNDPGRPIPASITDLTGITDDIVRGQSIDVAEVVSQLARASLVVAHHADFDRRMCERAISDFAGISWACSYREVEWERFGCTSKKLEHILASTCREFYDAHRAVDDCYVGVHCLAAPTCDGRPAFSYLLDAARTPTMRVWATGAAFASKDALKARRYTWDAPAKCWFIDVRPGDLGAETQWLASSIGVSSPDVYKLTARDRYSIRSGR